MNPDIFRMYDIRGVAESDLDDETIGLIGRAYASYLTRRADGDGALEIGVGRDIRTSSDRIVETLTESLTAAGLEVVDLGVVPTPLVYFATHQYDLDGSIQITGSHNPPEYNGLKMMEGHAPLYGEAIEQLQELAEQQDFEDADQRGSTSSKPALVRDYIEWVADDIEPGEREVRVALDGGNGVAGVVAGQLVEEVFGSEPVELFMEPDSSFPNHHPDPTVEENLEQLQDTVRSQDLDLGVAYDGDADRIGVVDDRGEVVWGDELLVLLSRDVLRERPGATIIGEVKCSQKLFDDIEANGGNAVMSQVGHSLMKAKLRETGAALAGEMSGHVFFNDRFFGFDDALYATCRLMEILSRSDESMSEMLADLPETHATPELRRDCPEAIKFDIPGLVAEYFEEDYEVSTVDGARIKFDDGWGLVRASNTQPKIVLRAEGRSAEQRDDYLEQLETAVAEAKERLADTS